MRVEVTIEHAVSGTERKFRGMVLHWSTTHERVELGGPMVPVPCAVVIRDDNEVEVVPLKKALTFISMKAL